MSKAAKEVVTPSLAASVVLLSPLRKAARDGYNYRIVLLKRRSKGTFASSSVFPGGNIEKADSSTDWDSLLPVSTDEERAARTVRIGAIRETFEESGLLLEEGVGAGKAVADALTWRERVHSDATTFLELFRSRSTKPATSSLALRSNWLTPKGNPKRFDTWFWLALVPKSTSRDEATLSTGEEDGETSDEAHVLAADGKETVSAEWLTPGEALRRSFARSIHLMPPQVYTLADMPKDWKELLVPGSESKLVSHKHVSKWEVRFAEVTADDGSKRMATVLPGDPEYPGRKPAASDPRARHRNYLATPKEGTGTFYVIGCQRRGVGEILGEAWSSELEIGEVFSGAQAKL